MHPTYKLLHGSVLHHIASLQDPLDPCPRVNGDITQYLITFRTRSLVNKQNVTVARCTSGRCSYTFKPPSNPPSRYDSVSVAAENVVGVGAAKTCTTQTICEFNFYSCTVVSQKSAYRQSTLQVCQRGGVGAQ